MSEEQKEKKNIKITMGHRRNRILRLREALRKELEDQERDETRLAQLEG